MRITRGPKFAKLSLDLLLEKPMLRPFLRSRLAAPVLVLGLSLVTGLAHADTEGKRGRITRIRINTSGSDEHPLFVGAITVKLGSGSLVEYRWGGSSCPGQKLSEPQLALLGNAFAQRDRTRITPLYTMGEGPGTRCLVGFELSAG